MIPHLRPSPLLAGLLAVGCGDKDDSGDSGVPTPGADADTDSDTDSDTDADTDTDSGVVVTFTGTGDTGHVVPEDSGTAWTTWSWYTTYVR